MKLYGTTTSPFVRRVRVVAAELGHPVEMVNTAGEDGQRALRALTPIGKVPIAELGIPGRAEHRVLFDSRQIIAWLVGHYGSGPLAPPRDPWRQANLVSAVDGALEGVITLFYLRRVGVAIDGTPFAQHEQGRASTAFEWLADQLAPDGRSLSDGLDLATLSLVCALDWMDFRATYPTDRHPRLAPLRAAWAERPSLAATRPHA